jgi:hypothetical protein
MAAPEFGYFHHARRTRAPTPSERSTSGAANNSRLTSRRSRRTTAFPRSSIPGVRRRADLGWRNQTRLCKGRSAPFLISHAARLRFSRRLQERGVYAGMRTTRRSILRRTTRCRRSCLDQRAPSASSANKRARTGSPACGRIRALTNRRRPRQMPPLRIAER